jgi:adenosine deaminase
VRCDEDPALVEELAGRRIPLTVCPLSNVKLRVVPSLRQHNLRRLLERGLVVTVNSDDPAFFGGYVGDNYRETQRALDLSRAHIRQLARNSFEASFLDAPARDRLLAEVDAVV